MEKNTIKKNFLNVTGLVGYIHLSKSTIYKMVSKNEIPYIKIGSRTLFDTEQIDKWVRRGGVMEENLPQYLNIKSKNYGNIYNPS